MSETPYEVTKFSERKWGVVFRMSRYESFKTGPVRKTQREAKADARMLNREMARLNGRAA